MTNSNLRSQNDQYFQLSPLYTLPGWYFLIRNGSSGGPFLTLDDAQSAASLMADECQKSGDIKG